MKQNRQLNFTGTHFEIGKQIGKTYKKWGKKAVFVPAYVDRYYQSQLKIYQNFFPSFLEQLEGIAKGLGIDQDKVFKSYLTGFLNGFQFMPGRHKPSNTCSEVLISNKNGVLVGSNYDWRVASESCSKLVEFSFSDNSANSFTSVSDMATWTVGTKADPKRFLVVVDEAWNEDGLYLGLNGAPGSDRSDGMSTPHLIQAVIEQCSNTQQAIALIKKVPITESKIFIVADKQGDLAVVEKAIGEKIKIRRSKELLFTTNHYNHSDLSDHNKILFDQFPFHSTFPRYAYFDINLRNDYQQMDAKSLFKLMNKAPALQNWRSLANGDTVTAWILVLNLKTGRYSVTFSPLNAEYKEVKEGK
jgi:predicted choloylglycine hydrolase